MGRRHSILRRSVNTTECLLHIRANSEKDDGSFQHMQTMHVFPHNMHGYVLHLFCTQRVCLHAKKCMCMCV